MMGIKHFYPRSPCGERPDMAVSYSKGIKISIHALLAESDFRIPAFLPADRIFLSTLSLRRATLLHGSESKGIKISIHALLAESDLTAYLGDMELAISIHALLAESDFNAFGIRYRHIRFLSTLSLRRATT